MSIFTCLPKIEHTVFEIDEMCRTVKCPESFFTKPVVKIRITIQDVYPGTKWQDTAISAYA